MIPFNKPPYLGTEDKYVLEAMRSEKISGDGEFSKQCQDFLESYLGCHKALLMPSCTHALEAAAILIDIQPGDEVIMPSYTFVSTANAFVLRGAKIVFVDIRPDTMNMDEALIVAAISNKTKAIVPVHYAGVSCDMDVIMNIAREHKLYVIEDAAQGIDSYYNNRRLGSIGHMAAFSFHETKNLTSGGEGGALIINDASFSQEAEIIREKGTNRSQFFRGMVDKYTWVSVGSSYLPCELQAAYLMAQLEGMEVIQSARREIWDAYYNGLAPYAKRLGFELPVIPEKCQHNAHMFYIKLKTIQEREAMITSLKKRGVYSVFHYVPLHTSPAGKRYSVFSGEDTFTTRESERLLRLPIWYGMTPGMVDQVINAVLEVK